MILTSNSKMLCKADPPSAMPECPRTASRARRCRERNATQSLASEAMLVGERSKTQRRVRTTCSAAVAEGRASSVPGRWVGCESLESPLVALNDRENRREWRSEENDSSSRPVLAQRGPARIEYLCHEGPCSLHCEATHEIGPVPGENRLHRSSESPHGDLSRTFISVNDSMIVGVMLVPSMMRFTA